MKTKTKWDGKPERQVRNCHYARGANFERRVKKHLEVLRYQVIRSAGSHSPVDLVAFRQTRTLCVQCKLHGKISPAERDALLDFVSYVPDGIPIIASKSLFGIAFSRYKDSNNSWVSYSPL